MGGHVEALEAFFECYDPAKLGSSETLLARYAGKEAAFFRGLDKKYGCTFFAVRDKIVALLEEHDPPKAAGVDRLLASKPKKEEAVLAALRKKYAVSDAAPAAAAAAAASPKPAQPAAAAAAARPSAPAGDGSPEVFLKSIQTFFKLHDAASLAKAGAFAEKFGGRQRDFYTSLGKKYGKTHFETRDELVAIARGAGDRAFDVDALMLAKLAGGTASEQQLIAAVRKKYGHASVSSAAASNATLPAASASAVPLTHKQRVAALFRAYAPDKAGGVDALLAKHAGNEEKLVAALVAKFGPEPSPPRTPAAAAAAAAGAVVAAQGPVDWAARITEFYRNYEPAKAAQAPALAAKYKGKEAALWTQLVRKYGPEPHWVERLERVVSESGTPVNRSNIIEKLVEFAGREDALYKIYVERYGAPSAAGAAAASAAAAAPTEAIPHAARVYRMYYQYNKEKLGTVPDLLAKYKGKEADLYAAMLQKYGSDAMGGPTRETDYERRMVNLYAVHNAEKLNAVPSLLAKYKGREPALIDGVKEKYGVTVEAGLQTQQSAAVSGVRTPSPLSYEQRMRNLYEKYNPDKVRTIPQALAKYRGHEEELMQALVERYGPEPPVQRTLSKEEVRQAKVGVIKEYYRRHKPYEYNVVPKVLAEWEDREDELIDVLRKEFGEVAAGEEEAGAAAAAAEGETEAEARERRARELDAEFPKLRRLRQDDGYCSTVAKQVVALQRAPPAQVLGREEAVYAAVFDFLHDERTGRWRLEEEAEEAARELARRGDDANYAARQREIHRLLEERSTSEHLRLAFRRWVAFLAGRLRCTAEVRDSLMSQKMSVYDQMQTNKYSIAAFERAEKTKAQRAVRSQSPQPAAAPPRRSLRGASPGAKRQPPRQAMARSAAEIRLEAQERRRTQQENMAIMRESKRLDDAERLRRSPRAVRSTSRGGQRLPPQQPQRQRRQQRPQSPGSPHTPRRLQEQQRCYDEAQRDRVGEAYASVALQYANPDAVLYAETLQLLTGTPETAVESEMRRRREAAAAAASPEALAPPVMLSPGAREI